MACVRFIRPTTLWAHGWMQGRARDAHRKGGMGTPWHRSAAGCVAPVALPTDVVNPPM